MSAHTAGPWDCSGSYGNHGLSLTGPHGEALGHVRAFIPSGEVRHGAPVQMRWEEGFANARLIAAAPELLEALQAGPGVLHTMPDGGACKCSQCTFVRLRSAAIAKATGEAS